MKIPYKSIDGIVRLTLKQARRLVVLVVGLTVVLAGVAMIVLPGPAFLVIPAGLAILAIEFVWARTLLKHVKQRAQNMTDAVRRGMYGAGPERPKPPQGD